MAKITVSSREVVVQKLNEQDYISITDFDRFKDAERADDLIRN